MLILGIDPSLRGTGYGVVRVDGLGSTRTAAVDYGVIKNAASIGHSECLVHIYDGIRDVIERHSPAAAAVEGIIYLQNYRTAITMGAARGAALLALAQAGIPIYEYAPRRVKSAATGRGGAQKQQVAFMMRATLGLTETPPPDAADALAIAVTHAQARPGLTQGKRM
ncbi:MAG: crossover junction endodeoxyribonuclease RuvC [Candidatus Methylacidiphilales bacterium]|nr:crossover junction endodeoxyribonuclease RuvC [Candidatus Methylacidiphilales bacterium]